MIAIEVPIITIKVRTPATPLRLVNLVEMTANRSVRSASHNMLVCLYCTPPHRNNVAKTAATTGTTAT
jgi:hypothetical protein